MIDITGIEPPENKSSNATLQFDGVNFIWYRITQAQGSVSGYTSGGGTPSAQNTIDKFSFTSDGNSSSVGSLTQARSYVTGQQV